MFNYTNKSIKYYNKVLYLIRFDLLILVYFESLTEIERNSKESAYNDSGVKQTWVCIVDLLPLAFGKTFDIFMYLIL